jgi:LacI family transcriptional regulator
VATASRVLSGTGHVAPDTRARIQDAIRRLNYHPNLRARGLRQRSSRSIGLIVPNLLNAYYTALADAISQTLAERGYHLLLAFTRDEPKTEQEMVYEIISQDVDGLIWVPADPGAGLLQALQSQRIPAVSIVRRISQEMPGLDTVVFADFEGGYAATQHLIGLGHERIGFIGGDVRHSSNHARWQGYLAALRAGGLPADETLIRLGTPRSTWGSVATIELLRLPGPPTAIFAASNAIMPGVMRGIRQYGVAVPDELSLICFDDVDWFSFSVPPITAISCSHARLAEAAADLLMRRVEGPNGLDQPPMVMEIPFELVVRRSTAPPRRVPLTLRAVSPAELAALAGSG